MTVSSAGDSSCTRDDDEVRIHIRWTSASCCNSPYVLVQIILPVINLRANYDMIVKDNNVYAYVYVHLRPNYDEVTMYMSGEWNYDE